MNAGRTAVVKAERAGRVADVVHETFMLARHVSSMRVLIVEDDTRLANMVRPGLVDEAAAWTCWPTARRRDS